MYHEKRCDTIVETVDSHRQMDKIYEINIHNEESKNPKNVENKRK